MKVYTFPRSRSLRVLWILEELSVSYETIKVDLLDAHSNIKSPHSRGKVPFLIDGEIAIEETLAIGLYLCNKYPNERFYPSNLKEQSIINAYISFALTDLESPIWNLLKQIVFIPEAQRSLTLVEFFRKESERVVNQFDMVKDQPWIAGDHFTLADIFTSHTLFWAKLSGIHLNETVDNYISRAMNRTSYLKALERNNH